MSSLPPRTAEKLRNLGESERKLYACDLLASYEAKGLKLEAVGARMAQGWVYIGIRSVTDAKRQGDRVDKCNPRDVQL